MHAAPVSITWNVRELELGLVHVERAIGGVRVRLEVYSGGGFIASTGVTRVAGRIVRFEEAGRG